MEFIELKTNFAFRRIFGSEDSKDALISFINAALKLENERRVVKVEVKNPCQVRYLPIRKDSIVDIACRDERGIEYLVEMQVEKVKGFGNRMIYDLAKGYSGQLLRGQNDPQLHDVVFISVMDFSLFEGLDSYRSLFVMKDVETNYTPLNRFLLCCFELGKFKKKEGELSGMLEKWIYFLKEVGDLKIRPSILKEEVFDGVFERIQVANLSDREMDAYDASIQEERDKRGLFAGGEDKGRAEGIIKGRAEGRAKVIAESIVKSIAEGRAEGKAEGIVKGRAEGRAEGRVEGKAEGIVEGRAKAKEDVALKMLAKGFEISFVAEISGLSESKLEALRKRF